MYYDISLKKPLGSFCAGLKARDIPSFAFPNTSSRWGTAIAKYGAVLVPDEPSQALGPFVHATRFVIPASCDKAD